MIAIDFKDINNNIIANRWKMRYNEQSEEVKNKLDILNSFDITNFQLKVIKRRRMYPSKGDIFKIIPKENIFLRGIVVNNHINNINGDDLLLIMIFNPDVNVEESINSGVRSEELLIPPQIVGKEYWTRGYFYNIGHCDKISLTDDYGFYSIGKGKFFDEYGNELLSEPKLLGTYGVCTISGIAREINKELIISGIL